MHRDYGGVGSKPVRLEEGTLRNLTHMALAAALLLLFAHAAPAASKAPATLKLTRDDLTAHITFENKQKLKVTSRGTRLKAGTYWVKSVRVFKKDEKKRIWGLHGMEALGTMKTITVAAGQEKILDCGPPINFHLWARQGKDAERHLVKMTLSAVGRYGEIYWPGAFLGRKKPPAPTFRIVDEDDKLLHSGKFKVAASGRCSYSWRFPPGFKGKFKIELKPTLGPFKWRSNRENHYFEME